MPFTAYFFKASGIIRNNFGQILFPLFHNLFLFSITGFVHKYSRLTDFYYCLCLLVIVKTNSIKQHHYLPGGRQPGTILNLQNFIYNIIAELQNLNEILINKIMVHEKFKYGTIVGIAVN